MNCFAQTQFQEFNSTIPNFTKFHYKAKPEDALILMLGKVAEKFKSYALHHYVKGDSIKATNNLEWSESVEDCIKHYLDNRSVDDSSVTNDDIMGEEHSSNSTSVTLMKSDILDTLMLLSALESWSYSTNIKLPDYLGVRMSDMITRLSRVVLE